MPSKNPLKIAILGGGTVGGGVIEGLSTQRQIWCQAGHHLELKYLVVRSPEKSRDFCVPPETTIICDWEVAVNDPEIDIFIEVLGGIDPAEKIISQALAQGKIVITANKAVIAKNLSNIPQWLSTHPQAQLWAEAAVGGGLPLLKTLAQDLLPVDPPTAITGILNGTTNFILTQLESGQVSFEQALESAQQKGYAEADPTADIAGLDIAAKIEILTALCWGVVPKEPFWIQGMSALQSYDFIYAQQLGAKIKFLSQAEYTPQGLKIWASPTLIPNPHPLANIPQATNAVTFDSPAREQTTIIGQGAGRHPTAAAVLSDLYAALEKQPSIFPRKIDTVPLQDWSASFYLRFVVKNQTGIIARIATTAADYGIGIDAVQQLPDCPEDCLPFVIVTESTKLSKLTEWRQSWDSWPFLVETPLAFPYLCQEK